MAVVAVDLAAKYSAAVGLSGTKQIEREFDSTGGEYSFITDVVNTFDSGFYHALIVEDLPHGVDYRELVKRVCQIQGRIVDRVDHLDRLGDLLFVAPVTWRKHYGLKQGSGEDAVVPLAAEHGYTPPDLAHLNGPRGGRALTNKVTTDYCAAYLIGCWAIDMYDTHGCYDVPGTNHYGEQTRRKREQA